MKTSCAHGVFQGPSALRDFLNPANHPPLPLVELPASLNPFADKGVRLFAKMMCLLPLGNVKSLPAYAMLEAADTQGKLEGVSTLIENSSGNTVFSLAAIGRAFGISRTRAIVSHEVSPGKLKLLQIFGVDVTVKEEPICPDPDDPESGIHLAARLGKEEGWFNPGQYSNAANPEAHERLTGPQMWEQTDKQMTVFCAGLGTTGTFVGAGAYLKRQSPSVVTVGVVRKPNNPVPGVRTPALLRDIAFDWKRTSDAIEEVGTKISYEKSLELCRVGLQAGPSSGFAYAGLLQFLRRETESGRLDRLRNAEGEVVAVFVCPDSPMPYLDEYAEFVDPASFPSVENASLLKTHQEYDLEPDFVRDRMYDASSHLLPGTAVMDIRSQREFDEVSLPGAERKELRALVELDPEFKAHLEGKNVLVVCEAGNRSRTAARLLQKQGINAYSLAGGMIAWSERDFHRHRAEACLAPKANNLDKKPILL